MLSISHDRIIRDFKELTSIDSVSFNEKTMADTVKARLIELGFQVQEDNASELVGGNANNIYGFLKGNLDRVKVRYEDSEGIILSAHMDTVIPGIGKKAIVREDGLIVSDGTTVLGSDDVSGIVAILDGIEYVVENELPRRDIEVIFTVAEEVYVRGAMVFDVDRVKFRDIYVLDLNGPVGTAAVKAPGIIAFEVTVHGHPAHAGFNPELGRNALKAAADCIVRTRMGHTSDDNTFNIGLIEAGKATNIVPGSCTFKGEARGYDMMKAFSDIYEMRKTLADSINRVMGEYVEFDGVLEDVPEVTYESINDNGIGYTCRIQVMQRDISTDRGDKSIKRFEAACEDIGIESKLIDTFGGSDLNVFANRGLTGAVLASGMNDVHSTSEWTTVNELVKSAALCAALVQPR